MKEQIKLYYDPPGYMRMQVDLSLSAKYRTILLINMGTIFMHKVVAIVIQLVSLSSLKTKVCANYCLDKIHHACFVL